MTDAEHFGNAGSNTLKHISESVESFRIPNLQRLGIANLTPLKHVLALEKPEGALRNLR